MSDRSSKASDGREPLTDMECGFKSFLLCNIAGDLCRADDVPMMIFYGRDGQRNIDALAVLANATCLKVINSFACANSGQDTRLIIVQLRRNNGCDRLPDDFLCPVAEGAFRGLVPTGDDPVQILADDGIVGGSNDCREP